MWFSIIVVLLNVCMHACILASSSDANWSLHIRLERCYDFINLKLPFIADTNGHAGPFAYASASANRHHHNHEKAIAYGQDESCVVCAVTC